jgi:hypothetical protein
MKNISLVSLATLLIAGSASAHGVEKILPADAHNVQIQSAELAHVATGETLVTNSNDSPIYDSTYSTELMVTVTYDSKDDSDAPKTGSGSNGEFLPTDSTQPTIYLTFDLSQAQLDGIKAKTLNPTSLVTVSVDQESVQIDDPHAQNVCVYDDNNNIMNNCVEPAIAQIVVTRPVLHVSIAE